MLFIQGDLMIMGHMLPAAWRCQEFATLSDAVDQGRLHVNLTVTMLCDDHDEDNADDDVEDANDALCVNKLLLLLLRCARLVWGEIASF